jgi:hypothetical protein
LQAYLRRAYAIASARASNATSTTTDRTEVPRLLFPGASVEMKSVFDASANGAARRSRRHR